MGVWIEAGAANVAAFLHAMNEFGFAMSDLKKWAGTPEKMLRMGYPPVRIEVMTVVSGLDLADAYSRAEQVEWDDLPVRMIGLSDLRANKRAAGRHKDLDDLENLPDPS